MKYFKRYLPFGIDSIIDRLERFQTEVEDAIEFHEALADYHDVKAEKLRDEADAEDDLRLEQEHKASKAKRLSELLDNML